MKDRYVYLEIHERVSRIQSENTYFSIFTRRKIHSKKVGGSTARQRDEAWRIPDDKCRTPWQTDVQSRILSAICRAEGERSRWEPTRRRTRALEKAKHVTWMYKERTTIHGSFAATAESKHTRVPISPPPLPFTNATITLRRRCWLSSTEILDCTG